MVRRAVFCALSLTAVTAALADDTAGTQYSLLADLKGKCAEFVSNPQMKPVKVNLTCNELSQFWRAKDPVAGSLPNSRTIGVTVQLKSAILAPQMFNLKGDDTSFKCQQFVKVERRVGNVDMQLTCEDIGAIEDLGAYCAPILLQRAEEDPALVQETITTTSLDLCPKDTSTVPGEGTPEG